ncbi:hypothetical protein F5ESL0230_02385 [Lactobacillus sp. ESL0230]|nr:hypothetical protein F5ESL0230_02385 [Lactobacillus sp. ESL0230]
MNLINLKKRHSLSKSVGVLLAIGALTGGLAFSNNSVKADNAQMKELILQVKLEPINQLIIIY